MYLLAERVVAICKWRTRFGCFKNTHFAFWAFFKWPQREFRFMVVFTVPHRIVVVYFAQWAISLFEPNIYTLQEHAQISGRRRVQSKMAAAQLSTIKTQLIETIFTPKFAMGGGAELRKPPPCNGGQHSSKWYQHNWAQLIPGDLASKIAMGGWRLPNQPDLTLKFEIGERAGETFFVYAESGLPKFR